MLNLDAMQRCTPIGQKNRPIKSRPVPLMQVKKNKQENIVGEPFPLMHSKGGGGSVERRGPLRSPFGSPPSCIDLFANNHLQAW